jgi:ribosomal RNA-processing protein 36
MAENLLRGRVRASKNEDEEQFDFTDSEEEQSHDGEEPSSEDREADSAEDDDEDEDRQDSMSDATSQSSEEPSRPAPPGAAAEPEDPLATITFGALASAQATLGTDIGSKKRKRAGAGAASPPRRRTLSPFHEADERRAGKHAPQPARTSKHAPAEQSSKKAVSRKRTVVHVPALAARDPRFSALSGRTDPERVRRNYAFLDTYRASELDGVKRRARDPKAPEAEREQIKGEVRAMEDRERARKREEAERDVMLRHRREEREKVAQGVKQPYFLKKSEVRREVLRKRFEDMGEKKAEQAMARKRKKTAQKERKNMPDARRSAVEEG